LGIPNAQFNHRPEAVMHIAAHFGAIKPEWCRAMELGIDEVMEAR